MNPSIDEFPVLGVGASLSFGIQPDPVALAEMNGGPSFIEYAGAVQVDLYQHQVDQLRKKGIPVLYHPSCMNLCGPWPNDAEWLKAIAHHVESVGSPWLAQDVAVCYAGEKPGYSIQLGYFVAPILTEASLAEAVQRVLEVRSAVHAPLLLEPPPATFRMGPMSMFEWLGKLAEQTDCGLLLDSGHILSHQLVEGQRGLDLLPLDRVVEVHIAGGILSQRHPRRYFVDAHDLPIQPETWEVFDDLLTVCPNLKAVCLECEGSAPGTILAILEQVRQHVHLNAANASLRTKVRADQIEQNIRSNGLEIQAVSTPTPIAIETKIPAPEIEADTGYPSLLRLLFDNDLRQRLENRDPTLADELSISQELLNGVDPVGLSIDAEGRQHYLMSALCRSHPRGAGLVGALPDGSTNLLRFLASPHVFESLEDRNQAFSAHLKQLLLLAPLTEQERVFAMAFVEFESGLVRCAAELRQSVRQGAKPPTLRNHTAAQKRNNSITLAPFTVLVELPHSPHVLETSMHQIGPTDAWSKISSGLLDLDRIRAILRAEPNPVTIIARGIASGWSERAGAGGISPS